MFLAKIDIGGSVTRAFDQFFVWLPLLLGGLAILVIGYFVAKIIGGLIGKVLQKAGLDRTLEKGQAGTFISKVTASPSKLLGRVVFWVIFFGAVSLAVSVLGIQALQDLVASIYAYLPNVIAAVLIFLAASLVAGAVVGLVKRTMADTPTGKVVAAVVPILVMAIAGFMILDQLRIAPTIVTITYAAIMGAVALGTALAFGLGGREVAGQMLDGAYQTAQEQKEQVKQDVQAAKERAKQEVERIKREQVGNDEASLAETGSGQAR